MLSLVEIRRGGTRKTPSGVEDGIGKRRNLGSASVGYGRVSIQKKPAPIRASQPELASILPRTAAQTTTKRPQR